MELEKHWIKSQGTGVLAPALSLGRCHFRQVNMLWQEAGGTKFVDVKK